MCDRCATAIAAIGRYGVRRETVTSICDDGVCDERRQAICVETFRVVNAACRRGALRVRYAALLNHLFVRGADRLGGAGCVGT
jgi:hypothetical protein